MKLNFLASLLVIGCRSEPEVPRTPPLDAKMAQLNADAFTGNMFPGAQVQGPICLPEAVYDQTTQCSFTVRQADGTYLAGTLLCDNNSCREGEAPALVAQDTLPTAAYAAQDGGIPDEWLLWYMLANSGGTHYGYNSWYNSTPSYYRQTYYSRGYQPSVATIHHYHTTYAAPIQRTMTVKYKSAPVAPTIKRTTPAPTSFFGRKTTSPAPTVAPSTTPSSTSRPVVAPRPAAPKPAPAVRPSPKSSSGFGTSRSSSRGRR